MCPVVNTKAVSETEWDRCTTCSLMWPVQVVTKIFLFGQWGHGAVWTVFNCTD